MSRAIINDSDPLRRWSEYGQAHAAAAPMVRATVLSVALHFVLFGVFLALPDTHFRDFRPLNRINLRAAVPLVAPRSPELNQKELTQKDPNDGEISRELDMRSALPAAPAARAFRPPAPAGPSAIPAPVLGAAPQIEAVVGGPDIGMVAGILNLPPPVEQPKLVLEGLSPAPTTFNPPENPTIRAPRQSVEEAIRAAAGGGGGGLNSDGKASDPSSLGTMQLMSDPQGVDFKPYMLQVLAKVRRNWFSVIPAIARTGRPGMVQVQFIIDKQGGVPKLVIASTSGTLAFDRAAVASISASYPFPALPAEYRGTEIRLQLAFSYNLRPTK